MDSLGRKHAGIHIETAIKKLNTVWAKNIPTNGHELTKEEPHNRIDLINAFVLEISDIVFNETQDWMTEFSLSIQELQKNVSNDFSSTPKSKPMSK